MAHPRMRHSSPLFLLLGACLAAGCNGIEPDGDYEDGDYEDGGGHPPPPPETPLLGTPCAYRHGEHTLESWGGESDASYQAGSFSFEVASNELDLTSNDVDLLFQRNNLQVNTVADDRSFIVDLGVLALDAVPPTVNAADYPTGEWDEHDSIQAVAGHTYVVRTVDGNTRQWAAFRISALVPSVEVTIEWIRSPDPEALRIPTDCL